jgi:putative Holliday junction resolvase
LALSDPLGVTCAPLEVIHERDRGRLCDRVVALARDKEVGRIVVGLPRSLRGGTNPQAESVLGFVERLKECWGMQVETWDERFTSRLAEAGRRRGAPLDAVAACYMLQNYLDAQSGRRDFE